MMELLYIAYLSAGFVIYFVKQLAVCYYFGIREILNFVHFYSNIINVLYSFFHKENVMRKCWARLILKN